MLVWPLFAAGLVAAQAAEPRPFRRPEADAIRLEVRNILSDPRYAPRRSFREWLFEKLSNLEKPDVQLGGFRTFLFWFFLVWLILALLAILGHLAWTLLTLWRGLSGTGRQSRLSISARSREETRALCYSDLLSLTSELARQGAFRDAIGVMIVALLRRLDEWAVVRFHESKTSGDYVREYPVDRRGRGVFRQFVLAADQAVYGTKPCRAETYSEMKTLFERTLDDVDRQEI